MRRLTIALHGIRAQIRANAIPLGISFIAIAFGAVSEADYRDQVATAARLTMSAKINAIR